MKREKAADATTSHTKRKQRLPRLRTLGKIVLGVLAAIALLAVAYGIAPLIYWTQAVDHNWGYFFEKAATPYGAMTAGFAALAAAGIAYNAGAKQRKQDREHADRQHEGAREQLAATQDAAAKQHQQAQDQLAVAREQLATAKADTEREHNAQIIRDLRTRFTTATKQLADKTTTIQQAGAYALASLADDWLQRTNTQEAQVCIDVLCTYLRTHHHTAAADQGLPHGNDYDYTQQPPDQPVRDTIIQIIRTHTQSGDQPGPWSNLTYDLSKAHLHDANFNQSQFHGNISFNGAQFHGEGTLFGAAQFTGENTSFDEAQFHSQTTSFGWAQFHSQTTRFTAAQFDSEIISFDAAKFHSWITWFNRAQFRGKITSFGWAQFHSHTTSFDAAQFHSQTTMFRGAKFGSGLTSFEEPKAWRNVVFDWDNDYSQKPANVHPSEWPPQVVPVPLS